MEMQRNIFAKAIGLVTVTGTAIGCLAAVAPSRPTPWP
jgi:hypothetical protein